MAATLADLDKAIADEDAALGSLAKGVAQINTALLDLIAAIKAGGTVDVTKELQAIQADTQTIATATQSLAASDTAAQATFGALGVTPATLTLSLATTPSGTVNASEAGYFGVLAGASDTPGVATVQGGANGPQAAFQIAAVAVGSANVTITDDHGGSAVVAVTVTA